MSTFIAEDETEEVEEALLKVKDRFKNFESVHNIHHDTLSDDADLNASDMYFYDVQNNYAECLLSTKSWLKRGETAANDHPDHKSTSSSSSLGQREFLALMNLPKVELEPCSGDLSSTIAYCSVR